MSGPRSPPSFSLGSGLSGFRVLGVSGFRASGFEGFRGLGVFLGVPGCTCRIMGPMTSKVLRSLTPWGAE